MASAGQRQPKEEASFADHGRAEVGPVGVFAAQGAAVLDQPVDYVVVVVGVVGDGAGVGRALAEGASAEVWRAHMQARAWGRIARCEGGPYRDHL